MYFSNYPKAIPYLFLTEMWERFSYYGITAILILYMNQYFDASTEQVYAIYGAYGALVYMTPLIGGYLADRYLGSYVAVMVGGLLITLGHFVVALPLSLGDQWFYLGLAVIIVGTGLFIPNINAMVGHLYQADDLKRTNGFTLAYMGRNIGTIIAPVICATVAAYYNWRLAFVVAGIGMLIGLFIFSRGKAYYSEKSKTHFASGGQKLLIIMALMILTLLSYTMLKQTEWIRWLLIFTVVGVSIYIIRLSYTNDDPTVYARTLAAMSLTAFFIVFMILLQQSGGALNLFTEHFVDRQLWGITIQTGAFQSIEPLALVILTPWVNRLWDKLAARDIELSDSAKFILAIVLMSGSFVLMSVAMQFTNGEGLIHLNWVNAAYVLQASGELFIGPVGLAMVSRLIPQSMQGLFMGFWVLAMAVANFIAAKIGAFITPELHATAQSISAYQQAFGWLSVIGLISAGILALLKKPINRLIG